MALPNASTVSRGAGVLALGVATLVVFVVLAMLAGERSETPSKYIKCSPVASVASAAV
jgi:hypothetical protein